MEDHTLEYLGQSIRLVKDSFSKEITEIRSLMQQLLSLGERVQSSPLEFGRFHGENPEAWIAQAEHYFKFYGIIETHKLSLASHYLDGEALRWYQWLFLNKQLDDWNHFTEKVRLRFRKRHGSSSSSVHFAAPNIATHSVASNRKGVFHVPSVFDESSHHTFDVDSQRNRQVFGARETKLNAKNSSGENVLDEMPDRENSILKHSRLEPPTVGSIFCSDKEAFMVIAEDSALTQVQLFNKSFQQANHKIFADEQSNATSIPTIPTESEYEVQNKNSTDYQLFTELLKNNCHSKVSPTPIIQNFHEVQSGFEVETVDSYEGDNNAEVETKKAEIIVPLAESIYVVHNGIANYTSVERISTLHHLLPNHFRLDFPFDPGSHLSSSVNGTDVTIVVFKIVEDSPVHFCWLKCLVGESMVDLAAIILDCFYNTGDAIGKTCASMGVQLVLWDRKESLTFQFHGGVTGCFDKASNELHMLIVDTSIVYDPGGSTYNVSGLSFQAHIRQVEKDSLCHEMLYLVLDHCEEETYGNQVYSISLGADSILGGDMKLEQGWKIFGIANEEVNDNRKVHLSNFFCPGMYVVIEDHTVFGLLLPPDEIESPTLFGFPLPPDVMSPSRVVISENETIRNNIVDMGSWFDLQLQDSNNIAQLSHATNLEDKVLIDDGGIVMNVTNHSEGIDEILESYLWDPG